MIPCALCEPIPSVEREVEVTEPVFYQVPFDIEQQLFIKEVCRVYNFDDKLIYQIAYCESKFNIENNIKGLSCKGLLAVSTKYAPSYIKKNDQFDFLFENGVNVLDFKQNVVLGVRILSYWRWVCKLRNYNSISSVLECYNRGFNYFKNTTNKSYSKWVLNTNIEVIK